MDQLLQLATEELSKPTKVFVPHTVNTEPGSVKKNKKRKTGHGTERVLVTRKSVSLTTPIIPQLILQHVTNLAKELDPKVRSDLVVSISKYWSLKKESLRGAALLKRLHLEVLMIKIAMDCYCFCEQRR